MVEYCIRNNGKLDQPIFTMHSNNYYHWVFRCTFEDWGICVKAIRDFQLDALPPQFDLEVNLHCLTVCFTYCTNKWQSPHQAQELCINFARWVMKLLALVPLPTNGYNCSQPHGQLIMKANNYIVSHKPRQPHLHHWITLTWGVILETPSQTTDHLVAASVQ